LSATLDLLGDLTVTTNHRVCPNRAGHQPLAPYQERTRMPARGRCSTPKSDRPIYDGFEHGTDNIV
jgi:hypothetical protein